MSSDFTRKEGILVFHCCITNYQTFRGLKHHPFIGSQFCSFQVPPAVAGFSAQHLTRLNLGVSWAGSHLEALRGDSLPSLCCWPGSVPSSCRSGSCWPGIAPNTLWPSPFSRPKHCTKLLLFFKSLICAAATGQWAPSCKGVMWSGQAHPKCSLSLHQLCHLTGLSQIHRPEDHVGFAHGVVGKEVLEDTESCLALEDFEIIRTRMCYQVYLLPSLPLGIHWISPSPCFSIPGWEQDIPQHLWNGYWEEGCESGFKVQGTTLQGPTEVISTRQAPLDRKFLKVRH